MDNNNNSEEILKKYSQIKIKELMVQMDLVYNKKNKQENIKNILSAFNEYSEYKKETDNKYTKIRELGRGKEGVTYLVRDINGEKYAMKTFKETKSPEKIHLEASLQNIAAEYGIAPIIIETDTVSKYIVMDILNTRLIDVITKNNGILSIKYQEKIIKLLQKLDICNVFHGDSNIGNLMIKNNKLYLIDYGFSKLIDSKLKKKLKTDTPNMTLMLLGFILKLKQANCPSISYSLLINHLAPEIRLKYDLDN